MRAVGRGVKGEAIAKKLEGAELVDLPVDVRPLRVPFFFFSSVLSTSVSLSLLACTCTCACAFLLRRALGSGEHYRDSSERNRSSLPGVRARESHAPGTSYFATSLSTRLRPSGRRVADVSTQEAIRALAERLVAEGTVKLVVKLSTLFAIHAVSPPPSHIDAARGL